MAGRVQQLGAGREADVLGLHRIALGSFGFNARMVTERPPRNVSTTK
jgi:hypothetical protein